ncbi:hypothetical protein Agub_g10572, partial [Astrephomene gubernaculifera]
VSREKALLDVAYKQGRPCFSEEATKPVLSSALFQAEKLSLVGKPGFEEFNAAKEELMDVLTGSECPVQQTVLYEPGKARAVHSVKEIRDAPLHQHLAEVTGSIDDGLIRYCGNLTLVHALRYGGGATQGPISDAEALNPGRSERAERFARALRASLPHLFATDTYLDRAGVGATEVYHGLNTAVCDMLAGSKGSLTGSHEDYPMAAPSVIVVLKGHKLVWIAPGSFRTLIENPKYKKADIDLLVRSMSTVDPALLASLCSVFGGEVLELRDNEVGVVPPCCVHAAYNVDATVSVNYTVCSQAQWLACVQATALTCQEERAAAAAAAAAKLVGSKDEGLVQESAQRLLRRAAETGGSESFEGCVVLFNKGYIAWMENRIRAEVAVAKALQKEEGGIARMGEGLTALYKRRLDSTVRIATIRSLLEDGGGVNSLLATGATVQWRQKMCSLLGGIATPASTAQAGGSSNSSGTCVESKQRGEGGVRGRKRKCMA